MDIGHHINKRFAEVPVKQSDVLSSGYQDRKTNHFLISYSYTRVIPANTLVQPLIFAKEDLIW